eukprot:TRINITY_DN5479_c0_g5_i1.p1 TRINITY_DN5479_c0_g5~~TRINITY_DN5479_c0_g5_i1.p1  ORF type:complete len:378 (+),score=39.51 TRINITY_DN5479_c0_g5_i1:69-1136(+)
MADRRESHFGWKSQHGESEGWKFEGGVRMGHDVTGKEMDQTTFCVRYSLNGKYAAATFGNGAVKLYDTKTWQPIQRLRSLAHNADGQAATAVRWRPHCPTKSVDFIVSTASGVVQQWSWDENPARDAEYTGCLLEPENEILCCEYSPDGNSICSVGADRIVRIYDTLSGNLQHELSTGVDERGYTRPGHNSRIFSCRFVSPHVLITAGWESPCQVWDLRTGRSERQFLGTHVCADALEVDQNSSSVIVTSYRAKDQVQVFDYLSGRESTPPGLSESLRGSCLYTSKLASDQTTLICCGSKPNGIYLVDIRTGALRGLVSGFQHTMFSCDINPSRPNEVLLGGSRSSLATVLIGKQ